MEMECPWFEPNPGQGVRDYKGNSQTLWQTQPCNTQTGHREQVNGDLHIKAEVTATDKGWVTQAGPC